jgi:hypothetical protein
MLRFRFGYRFLVLTFLGSLFLSFAGTGVAFSACSPTGYLGLTAAKVNPSGTVSGDVDATGCDMGVYYDRGRGLISNADIHGALWYGVFVNGDSSNVTVNINNSSVYDIGDSPFTGNQRGVGIYYRAYLSGTAVGKISGNKIYDYQKGGIVTNGIGTKVTISDNDVTGLGPVGFIAQNGIQVGYGADASVMRNTVSDNSYTGTSTVSGGIIVVGGPGYGSCPGGNPCAYTVGTQIVGNIVSNNDIGVFLTNIDEGGNAPATATNVKTVNNTISSDALQNNYGGFGYQAGVSDVGNNDKIITNTIFGNGYDPTINPTAYTVFIDADPSFTNRPKVHANK